ncbi:MAG: LysR family transcriptional regulator [Corynebacterium sp.]|uniref:LysR family transcriptional regulator n=1 Tax=Corynebacterium sp. TaxID=1720 RepID=UPI003EFEAA20
MNLRNLDLNLLVLLDALLTEKSVTRAAELIGLSQPTLSIALSRLRRHFDDPILVRQGNAYVLTPLGTQLQPLTATVLHGVERVFSSANAFVPKSAARRFSIMTSDYGASVLAPAIARILREESPTSSIHFVGYGNEFINEPEAHLRFVDGMLMPSGVIRGFPHTQLFTDDWVCLVGSDNESIRDELTMDDLSRLPWVTTSHQLPTAPQRQLEIMGFVADAAVQMESFTMVAALVAGTDRVGIVQKRLVSRQSEALGAVRVLPCPFVVPPLIECFWWHPLHEHDPGHRWLRTVIERAAASVGPRSEG